MADDVDVANDYAETERQRQVANMLASIGKGRSECDCGESISELRKSYGARRCMLCQSKYELRHGVR